MSNPQQGKPDHGPIREGGMYLAMLSMKDVKWNKALAGDDATSQGSAWVEKGARKRRENMSFFLTKAYGPDLKTRLR